MTEDEIQNELARVAAEHPDILLSESTWLSYQQCVLDTGDFDLGYTQFARQEADLAIAAYEGRLAGMTPIERAAIAVDEHLRQQAWRSK